MAKSMSEAGELLIRDIRAKIWKAAKGKVDIINEAKSQIRFDESTPDYEALLKQIRKTNLLSKRTKQQDIDPGWKERYRQAHLAYQKKTHPNAINDQQTMMSGSPEWEPDMAYLPTDYPDVYTGNGLNRFMINFLFWSGWRVTRQNVEGREIKDKNGEVKRIKSATRTGTADISVTIMGRSVQLEGKAGKDKPRDEQLREQKIERAAGGVYEFVSDPNEFYILYDGLIKKFSGCG